MKPINYLASLLPVFSKNRVLEDCRITRAELKEATLPSYQSAITVFKGSKWKSKELEDKAVLFKRTVQGGGSMIVAIEKALNSALTNLDAIEKYADETIATDLAASALTFSKSSLLQYIESIAFVSKYARKFLNYVYICETSAVGEIEDGVKNALAPAEIKMIDDRFFMFCNAINIVNHNPTDIIKKLKDVPDVVINDDNAITMGATQGMSRIDPFNMGLIPVWMNPIYHVRMMVAEWQGERYKIAKEELRLIQLRKLNYERLLDGKSDAAIEKEIAYLESRCQNLTFKIAKMEENAHV